jgi:hypothetical protein
MSYTDQYLGERVAFVFRRTDGALLMEQTDGAWTFPTGTVEQDELPYEACGRTLSERLPMIPRMAGGRSTLTSPSLAGPFADENGVAIHAGLYWGWSGEPPSPLVWVDPSYAWISTVLWVRQVGRAVVRKAQDRPDLFVDPYARRVG